MFLKVLSRYHWKSDFQFTNQTGLAIAEIDDADASDLRELCSDYLTEVGFDEDYEPNEEGKILETLVDKLYRL